jgi:hypothetical protein
MMPHRGFELYPRSTGGCDQGSEVSMLKELKTAFKIVVKKSIVVVDVLQG